MQVNINGVEFFRVTSGFQAEDTPIRSAPHTGIDLAMYEGTPLVSASEGTVSQVYIDGVHGGIGNGIKVTDSNGVEVIYGHLSEVLVKVGDKVNLGEVIGKSGNTGNSTGPHLHLGAKVDGSFIDPQKFIDIIQKLSSEILESGWSTVYSVIFKLF